MTDRGVIYYATGKEYIEQALLSAESLKLHNDLRVTVYADREIDSHHVDETVTISPGEHPFYDRINYFKQSPYRKTLYLDTDTYVTGDLEPVFELLDRFEIAAAFNESRDTAAPHTKFETVDIAAPDSFPEYQCGVIAYRNTERVQQLFDDWQRRFEPYRSELLIDQPHFREALYDSDIVIGTLPAEYNTLINFGGYLHGRVILIHYAGKNRGKLNTGIPDQETLRTVATRLNRNAPQNRVFFYNPGRRLRVVPTRMPTTLRHRAVELLRTEGIVFTVRRGVQKALRTLTQRQS